MTKPSICLVMIVKDGAETISRAIQSVKPFIETYCILIDESTKDNTHEIIQRELSDLPGAVHFTKWVDFGTNRSLALEHAASGLSSKYVLMLDADDTIEVPDNFEWPELIHDAYFMNVRSGGVKYVRQHLFRNDRSFHYVGVVHELPERIDKRSYTDGRLDITYAQHNDGFSWKDQERKYIREAKILTDALKKDPSNTRYAYYLAQSWYDAGKLAQALKAYRHRTTMGGFYEEVWMSYYRIADILEKRNASEIDVVDAYLTAFRFHPRRVEPLYRLALLFREHRPQLSYIWAAAGVEIEIPKDDRLCIDRSIYEWKIHDEFAIGAYHVGRYETCIDTCTRLLKEGKVPEEHVARFEANIAHSVNQLTLRGIDYNSK